MRRALMLTLIALTLLVCAPASAPAHTVPGTSTKHVLGIRNTAQTPAWKHRINDYVRTHEGVDRWRTIFRHYRAWQLRCRAAGKGNGYVWAWSWGRAIMTRESHGLWNAYNPLPPYCAGPWQLAICHRARMGWSLISSVHVWHQWYLAARLFRDSGTGPWAL